MDPRRFCGLPRGNAKDGQSTRNDGSICSPVQSSSPKVRIPFQYQEHVFGRLAFTMYTCAHTRSTSVKLT